jgi:uncharacterized Rmd1/YagE family protein
MTDINAYQIADDIPLKRLKAEYKGQLISEAVGELFYRLDNGYVLVLNYGVISFADVDAIDRTKFIQMVLPMCPRPMEKQFQEDFTLHVNPELGKPSFDYNSMTVPVMNEGIIRITMLQVAQSCALDYYSYSSENLFAEIGHFTEQLEKHGRLSITRKRLLQFIGRALNTKNHIFDNLYVLDSPPVVWDDELLGRVNEGLYKTFDIGIRFREIDHMLKIISENLDVFIEINNVRQSHLMEIIIIVLITIEVAHLLFTMIFT